MLERHIVPLPHQAVVTLRLCTDCASLRYQFVMFPLHPTSVTDAQNTHIFYFTPFTHTTSAVCPWDSKCPLPLKVRTPSSGVSRSGQVRSFSCSLSVTSRPAGQHAAAPTLPCTILRHPPPLLPIVPHVPSEAIAPCYTLPKDKDAHKEADAVTDIADRTSQSSPVPSMLRPHLHFGASNSCPRLHPTTSFCRRQQCLKHPSSHEHTGSRALGAHLHLCLPPNALMRQVSRLWLLQLCWRARCSALDGGRHK